MSRPKIGERAGALLSGNNNEVKVLGYGVYIGEEVPVGAGGFMGEAMAEEGITNPCIELDSGEKVYGCECWWGPEEQMRASVAAWVKAGAKEVAVSIGAIRKEEATR